MTPRRVQLSRQAGARMPEGVAPMADELNKYNDWPRLACSSLSRGVYRPWTRAEMAQLYARGWKDGAAGKRGRPDGEDLPPYRAGYADGALARTDAIGDYNAEIGYEPQVLRDAGPVDG